MKKKEILSKAGSIHESSQRATCEKNDMLLCAAIASLFVKKKEQVNWFRRKKTTNQLNKKISRSFKTSMMKKVDFERKNQIWNGKIK